MSRTKIEDKLDELASKNPPSQWKERLEYRIKNEEWLKKSTNVALTVLDILDAREMSQTDLAKVMDITRQQISRILKGHENMTLETITKLEIALGIKLGRVLDGEELEPTKSAAVRFPDSFEVDILPILNVNVLRKRVASKSSAEEAKGYIEREQKYYAGENSYAIAS